MRSSAVWSCAIRLSLILPPVRPESYPAAAKCPHAGCEGRHVQQWQAVARGKGQVAAMGTDLTSVRCAGQWLTVGVSVDAVHGTVLSLDLLPNGEAVTLTAWVQDLASVLGAELLVSDDADGFKTAADDAGLLESVGAVDAVSHLGRSRRRAVGWDQQRLRACHRLVGQGAASGDARRQAGSIAT